MMLGYIYKIVCSVDSSFIYIGSTMKTPYDRLNKHKCQYQCYKKGIYNNYSIYKYFTKYGVNNFYIIPIKQYNICDAKHLKAYEQLWLNKEKRNTNVINHYNAFKISLKRNNKVK